MAEAKEATAKVEEDAAKYELDSDDSYYDDEDAEIALAPTLEGGSDSNVPSLLDLAKDWTQLMKLWWSCRGV